MSLTPTRQIGAASLFLLSFAGVAEAYAPNPAISSMGLSTPVKKTLEALPLSPLESACINPGRLFDDGENIYVMVDQSESVLSIPIEFAETHWHSNQFPLPENPHRVLCPI